MSNIEPAFVPVEAAAKFIGIGKSKFYQLVSEGEIPLVKLGRKSLVPVKNLHEFAARLANAA